MSLHKLENCPIAEIILFVCLNSVGSLEAQCPHCSLNIDRSFLFVFIDAVVNDAERSTPTDACTAVDYDLVVGRRSFCRSGCCGVSSFSHRRDEVQDG